jgi:hypothetical protein
MTLLALPLALILPSLFGWLSLRLIEGRHPVLFNAERWTMGALLGLTLLLFLQFLLQVTLGVPFSFASFMAAQGIAVLLLGALWYAKKAALPPSPIPMPSEPAGRRFTVIVGVLLTWAALKAAFVGVTFLLLTPTYLQDSLSNWNLRGKVLFETAALTLVMPNEDPLTSPKGVSSYPPTVPMAKALLADTAGVWSEPLVNSIHGLWYLSAVLMLYFALRRCASRSWALLGTYLLLSLPLYLMHGTNAYADAFVSAHVFAAVSLLFHASRSSSEEHAASFLRLAVLAGGLLAFTKNEGLLVFLPPFVLCALLATWRLRKDHVLGTPRALRLCASILIGIACIAGPWLLFKWTEGLTFGNAKPFTTLELGWQPHVLFAVIVNTFSEGNWLLLFPLFFGLMLWRRRDASELLLIPTVFFLIVYVGQVMLYLFTGLSREALMQTGYARGLIQLMPLIVLITVLLLHGIRERIANGTTALAESLGMKHG